MHVSLTTELLVTPPYTVNFNLDLYWVLTSKSSIKKQVSPKTRWIKDLVSFPCL